MIYKCKCKFLLILFVVLSFSFNVTLAQFSKEKQEYIGMIRTNEGQIVSYKLIFSIAENGKIEGKTISDFYGKNCTESIIEGEINFKENLISFKEIKNITTKAKVDPAIFCFVVVNNLKLETIQNKTYIKGGFNAKYNSGEICAKGAIYLASAELLEEVKTRLKDNNNKNNDTISKEINKLKDLLSDHKVLTSNDVLKVKAANSKIKLVIWDSFKEDNDQVDILLNNKLLYDNIEILQERKTIEIELEEGVSELKILAENEGTSAKNTLTGFVMNGDKYIPFTTKLKKGEFVVIKFNK